MQIAKGEAMLKILKVGVLSAGLFICAELYAQPQEMPAVNPEFKNIDLNKDNYISADEMRTYQSRKFKELDRDGSGDLESSELKNEGAALHKNADLNNDGKVSADESDRQFREYFRQMDKNSDGQVSEAEYTDYWKLIYKF
ncbi:MAG: EF-hand domain-containing protein [Candidatus Omnitrophica bacterium]|jgi:Ca2+-binding EF-hand superfamily protein|nr:EF-hand domain-containing protein [Candidatus Omnitrophota bacterium]MDD3274672.1 EF-hand domain-containing protein [Candidatus Omnitrophota bacterium]